METVAQRYGLFDVAFDFGGQLPQRTGTPPLPFMHDYAVERRFTAVGPQTLYTPERGYGWGGTYGLVAAEAPKVDSKTLRASARARRATARARLLRLRRAPPGRPLRQRHVPCRPPGRRYEVTAILADRSASPRDHGPMTVRLQGGTRARPVTSQPVKWWSCASACMSPTAGWTWRSRAPPSRLAADRPGPHAGRPHMGSPPGRARAPRCGASNWPPRLSRLRLIASRAPPTTASALPVPSPRCRLSARAWRQLSHRTATHGRDRRATGRTLVEYYLKRWTLRAPPPPGPRPGALSPHRVNAGSARVRAERSSTLRLVSRSPGSRLRSVPASRPVRRCARVTLRYRKQNQMQTHERVEMVPTSTDPCAFVATIPGAHVSVEWDLMYHVEAVDALGRASFFPGLSAGTPYIIVPVDR